MSWWDASGITSLASQALKNAQKKIDKVLDIEDGPSNKEKKKKETGESISKNVIEEKSVGQEGDFWSAWMGTGGKKEANSAPDHHSSWSLPWSNSAADITTETLAQQKRTQATEDSVSEVRKEGELSDDRVDVLHGVGLDHNTAQSNHGADTSDWKDFPIEESMLENDLDESLPENVLDVPQMLEAHHDVHEPHYDVQDTTHHDVPETTHHDVQETTHHDVKETTHPDVQETTHHDVKETTHHDVQETTHHDVPETIHHDVPETIHHDVPETIHPDVQETTHDVKETTHHDVQETTHPDVQDTTHHDVQDTTHHDVQETTHPDVQETTHHDVLGTHHLDTATVYDRFSLENCATSSGEVNITQNAASAKHIFSLTEENSPAELQNISNLLPVEKDFFSLNSTREGSAIPLTNLTEAVAPLSDSLQEHVIGSADGTMVSTTVQGGGDDICDESPAVMCGKSELLLDCVSVASLCDQSSDSSSTLHTSTDMGNSRTSSDLDLPEGQASSTGSSSDTSRFDSSTDTVVDRSVVEPDPPYSLFADDATAEDSDERMSSSYVKCMIEEAMDDLSKTEDSGSENHSSGEKSESSKVDSERSAYSGHESSDEIETTTSSDIEIISAPHSNGEYQSFDLSPLKIALQRSVQGHVGSDSQSSSSANSKGELDRLSPERGEASVWRDEDFAHLASEEASNNPYNPMTLLKKLAEMAEVLQARESKLIQLSKDNHELTEDNNILRQQLLQLEETREAESADLTALTQEFTARLGEAEKKLQQVLKEKESLKQVLASTEKELEKRSAGYDLKALLDEKQEQVTQLLEEGEKLSKQQLQNSNIIKKLRAKERETDATIASQRKKLEDVTKELERLTSVLDTKEDMEKKQAEAINQLNSAVQRQDKEVIKLKSDLEDLQEKNRGLQAALDNSYKEIAELHRSNASQDSKAQQAALSAETHVREELKAAMEREQQRFRQEREAFIMQADDLRLEMARLEKEHSRREDLLRQDIAHLQDRLQQDEARSQDLTQSVTSATRPLLRQIENLQATFGAQSGAWEKIEKTLTDRLAECQTALALAQEKERTALDQLMEQSAKLATLEASSSRLKQEKAQLSAQLEADKAQLEELVESRNSFVAQHESARQKLMVEINQLKMDKIHLESQLTVEHTKLETERKKILALEEQLRFAQERPRSRGTPSPSSSLSLSRHDSMIGSVHDGQSSMLHWSFHDDGESSVVSGPRPSVYDSLRQSGAAVVVENLSSQLKLKEGEISQLQSEIAQLERTRESMARELVNLSNQNDELLEVKEAHRQLQEEFTELNGRYSAILQMYGEKEEQVQELRLDLQDVKEMYKTQIDALLAK
ncbi:TATA element modulatory factor-like isoform X2 [Physella acuta]|uniref:TATA element modulatory factor-like isoform X2 n=1 Tax=Physella acuta TaxID=109671 RepID=UPI0027DCCEB5|nr:TATA element modulatory factor-like isoform X2 [Physella acuta]